MISSNSTKNITIFTHMLQNILPRNPIFALRDSNWKMIMNGEYNVLIKNKTWNLVLRPFNVSIIMSMWIFRLKEKNYDRCDVNVIKKVGDGAT